MSSPSTLAAWAWAGIHGSSSCTSTCARSRAIAGSTTRARILMHQTGSFRGDSSGSIPRAEDVSRNRREEPRLQGAGGAENRSILGRM
jgi:hypothetical protein